MTTTLPTLPSALIRVAQIIGGFIDMRIIIYFLISLLIFPVKLYADDLSINDFYSEFRESSFYTYYVSKTKHDERYPEGEAQLFSQKDISLFVLADDVYNLVEPLRDRRGFKKNHHRVKVKIISGKKHTIGKFGWVVASFKNSTGGRDTETSWGKNFVTNYDKNISTVYENAKKNEDIKTLEKLKKDFDFHPISNKAKLLLSKIDEQKARSISSIKDKYKNSLSSLKGMVAFITDFNKNSKIGSVSYKDVYKDNDLVTLYSKIFKSLPNKISSYQWFISNYPESKESREALQNIYRLAFDDAKSIGTLESYNDFVIAYPYAEQVQEAQNRAYDLEEKVYSSWFSSDEKNSRALLVKSKQLERKMSEADTKARDGYRLVIDRMNKLLQDKYPAEEATLRYLESEEFKDFYRDLKKSLASIEDTLKRIDSNTSDLSSTLKNQSRMMDSHFRKAAQSREMAAKYTEQHRFWERYLKDKGI